ncbi:hypothetical protein CVD28_08895 [Bacillus sp. M6-12]|uniref:hypothetical protein n=1 Tax=Bacillus sp. M6-12 TaxID=2054166 RepID=UPI000C76824E|nr:hypothetical protein [Bacillus sp. M6-12]PLS17807.1 hypothetical protein CVD28_08895 [Bacillus sp. M6-12]
MKAEVYILGLFTFKDEDKKNKVFNDRELNKINENINSTDGLKLKNIQPNSRWKMYQLDISEIQTKIPLTKITSASMGYYHHRLIFRFQLTGKRIDIDLRKIRKVFNDYSKNIITNSIINPNKVYDFKHCDTYQLIFLRNRQFLRFSKEDAVFSNDTTTMTFDISEPSAIMPFGKKYNIRISIPSTIITSKEKVSDDFSKAMINAIYQSCLYEIKDKRKMKNETTELSEDQLVKLWQHIIDTMGGRTLDKNIAKISQTNLIVAVAALLLGLIAIDAKKIFSFADFIKHIFITLF